MCFFIAAKVKNIHEPLRNNWESRYLCADIKKNIEKWQRNFIVPYLTKRLAEFAVVSPIILTLILHGSAYYGPWVHVSLAFFWVFYLISFAPLLFQYNLSNSINHQGLTNPNNPTINRNSRRIKSPASYSGLRSAPRNPFSLARQTCSSCKPPRRAGRRGSLRAYSR